MEKCYTLHLVSSDGVTGTWYNTDDIDKVSIDIQKHLRTCSEIIFKRSFK